MASEHFPRFADSLSVSHSFDVIKFKLAHRDVTGKVSLFCFHKKEMMKQGKIAFTCAQSSGRCQLELAQDALIYFGENGFIKWTPSSDGSGEDWIVDIPKCKLCLGAKDVKDAIVQLSSYLGPKTVNFPSHKCVIWRCRGGPCKKGRIYNAGYASQDEAYSLSGGWIKFGPENDKRSKEVNVATDVEEEVFDIDTL